jgi:HEAT repeat protein
MNQHFSVRCLTYLCSFLGILSGFLIRSGAAAEPPHKDPVEALRRTLAADPPELVGHDAALIKRLQGLSQEEFVKALLPLRDQQLAARIKAVRTLTELTRALQLQEWRPDSQITDQLPAQDRKYRAELAQRFLREARNKLKDAPAPQRLACLTLLGNLGSRVLDPVTQRPLVRALVPDVAELCAQVPQRNLRLAAIRTLGNLYPEPKRLVQILQGFFTGSADQERRAAADALQVFIHTTVEAASGWGPWPEQPMPFLVQVAESVLPLLRVGLTQRDAVVRQHCLDAIKQLATVFRDRLIPEPNWWLQGNASQEQLAGQGVPDVKPLVAALEPLIAAVTRQLQDPDPSVCLTANHALEGIAGLRLKLLQTEVTTPLGKQLESKLRDSAAPLGDLLTHKNVNIRLAALYVLETLQGEAIPAGKAVVASLQDPDVFVRWAAVRTLGKMAPQEAAGAIAGLAHLLTTERNHDVLLATAKALGQYSPTARSAVPELGRAIGQGATDFQLAVLQALAGIGKDAQPAIPQVIVALSASESSIRAEAAKTLAGIGDFSEPVVNALLRALDDADLPVRQAAAEALLSTGP